MEPAGMRRNRIAGTGSDLAGREDPMERLGLFLDGDSGAAAFGLPEEKDDLRGQRRQRTEDRGFFF